MIRLTGDQGDAICELFNMAVGKAANSLSMMMNNPVQLSVPSVDIVSLTTLGGQIDDLAGSEVSGVIQGFDGKFEGSILVVFPETKSLELVRMLLSDEVPLDVMSEMEQEAMTEVGNVLLNACLGTIADILGEQIKGEVPSFVHGSRDAILNTGNPEQAQENYGMFVRIGFSVGSDDVAGYVVLVLEMSSMKQFIGMIDDFVASLDG